MTTQRAYELGLVNRVVPTGHSIPAAVKLAEAICEAAPHAVRYSKAVTRATFSLGKAAGAELRVEWLASEDREEGSPLSSRSAGPDWSGHRAS